MSVFKKLAGETVIYGVPSILGRFLNWWLTPLYTWMFLPAEFGILSNILAYVAFFQVILTYGMETSYFRYAGRSDKPLKVYTTSLIALAFTSLIFVMFVIIFSGKISNWIKKAIKKDEDVKLVGFGTFTKSKRKARTGRNPQTGAEIKIPASNIPKFKPGKEFKELIN